MKSSTKLVTFIFLGILGIQRDATAGEFQNLSFENPIMPFVPDDPEGFDRIPISQVMPGWTAYMGEHPIDLVDFNARPLSAAGISLYSRPEGLLGWPVIEGEYSALIQSGRDLFYTGEPVSASLAQIGLVGSQFMSVQMKIKSNAPFSVSMGGQSVEMVVLDQQPTYTLYGGDVSMFSGREAELRITSDLYFSPLIGGFGRMFLDDIEFSTMVVPEPSPWMLLGIGGILTLGWIRLHSKR